MNEPIIYKWNFATSCLAYRMYQVIHTLCMLRQLFNKVVWLLPMIDKKLNA